MAQFPADHPANRRRSERVMLQMTVTVVTETPDRAQVQEEAQTQVVNAHGGLIKLKMKVLLGQTLVIVNPRNKFEQSAHVVRIDDTEPDHFSVAFEFDEAAPNFWPINFPPADWVSHVFESHD